MPAHRIIAVAGSQPADRAKRFDAFCFGVGETLAQHEGVALAMAGRRHSRDKHFADEGVAHGFTAVLGDAEAGARTLNIRYAGEADADWLLPGGEQVLVEGRTRQARRFRTVHMVDGLFAVSGSLGTHEQVLFALATETPVLPAPCFHGSAERHFREHAEEFAARFGLSREEVGEWLTLPPKPEGARALAGRMTERLLKSLVRRCFIITPFADDFDPLMKRLVFPAVAGVGDTAVHLGRSDKHGNIHHEIEMEIARADYVICVLDGYNPNVLYELGMAHTLRKPCVLLLNAKEAGERKVPFDIMKDRRIEYRLGDGGGDAGVLETLRRACLAARDGDDGSRGARALA